MPCVECVEGCLSDCRVLALELFVDQALELIGIEVENTANQAQRIDVLSLVSGCATNGFDCEIGNGNRNMVVFFLPFLVGGDMIRIVKNNAAFLE